MARRGDGGADNWTDVALFHFEISVEGASVLRFLLQETYAFFKKNNLKRFPGVLPTRRPCRALVLALLKSAAFDCKVLPLGLRCRRLRAARHL